MTDPNDPRYIDIDIETDIETEPPDPAIERLLVDTFDHRAVRLGRGHPDLDGVFARVRRRRRQRRTVAALGSVAVLGGGVVGLMQLADGVGGDVDPQLTTNALGVAASDGGVWSCTGPFGTAPSGAQQFAECTFTDDGSGVFATTTIVANVNPVLAAPATTAPTDVMTEAGVTTTTGLPGIDVRELVVISPTEQQYTVTAGDSLFAIGRLFDVEMEILANYNAWPAGLDHTLLPGDVVLIPPQARVPVGEGLGGILIYKVQAGDTATQIARRFGVSLAELAEVNEWSGGEVDDIQAGDEIVIPSSSPVAGN